MSQANEDKPRIQFAKIKVEPREANESQATEEAVKCSICWSEPPVNAIKLDCDHIFCFLCIKSVAAATNRCALCRSEIDINFEADEIDIVGPAKLPLGSTDGHFWFYAGGSGWWMYDADTNKELEDAYQAGKKRVEKLIAGQVYVISLKNLRQYQKSQPYRARKICRNTIQLDDILGIAGIRDNKLLDNIRQQPSNSVDTDGLRF